MSSETRRRGIVACLLGLALGAQAAATVGYRYDGSGIWPGPAAPTAWSATEHLTWTTPLPSWSNASPAVGGGKVCVSSEPTSLICADSATGKIAWSSTHDVLDTLQGDARTAAQALVAAAEAAETELSTLRTDVSRLSREARANPSAETTARLAALQARMGALKEGLNAAQDYRTPPNQGLIGWSSPSPINDGKTVWAYFGNGVVSAHALDGTALWSRWLGPPPKLMLGYDSGTSASPVRADDLLVVPYRELTALDAATGAVRWTDPHPWPHYGPPAVTKVGGVTVLLLPDGRILRARDGVELAKDLASVWYISPVVSGDVVLYLESRSGAAVLADKGVTLKAYRLAPGPAGGVQTTLLWTTKVPAKDPFYGQPVTALGQIYLATSTGDLWTLDAATGAVLATREIPEMRLGTVYAGPMIAGGHLFVASDMGATAVLSLGPKPELLRLNSFSRTRAGLAFVDGRLYLRTVDKLYAIQ